MWLQGFAEVLPRLIAVLSLVTLTSVSSWGKLPLQRLSLYFFAFHCFSHKSALHLKLFLDASFINKTITLLVQPMQTGAQLQSVFALGVFLTVNLTGFLLGLSSTKVNLFLDWCHRGMTVIVCHPRRDPLLSWQWIIICVGWVYTHCRVLIVFIPSLVIQHCI